MTKKKDLFDPTNDKWVHDRFDLPPEQDLDHDAVRGRHMLALVPLNSMHCELRITCVRRPARPKASAIMCIRAKLAALACLSTWRQQVALMGGLGSRCRASRVVEVGAAAAAAGSRAGAVVGAGGA